MNWNNQLKVTYSNDGSAKIGLGNFVVQMSKIDEVQHTITALGIYTVSCGLKQDLTNCVHSYNRACNVHPNGVTNVRKFVQGIDWELNWELLIACPHRPVCFKKIRTATTSASILNTVVWNQYSIVQNSILNLLHHYLKFQVCFTDLSQSDIQTLYGLQIVNGIWQCVNSSWTGIF